MCPHLPDPVATPLIERVADISHCSSSLAEESGGRARARVQGLARHISNGTVTGSGMTLPQEKYGGKAIKLMASTLYQGLA